MSSIHDSKDQVFAGVVAAVADAALVRVRDRVVALLGRQTSDLAGEDSGLGTVWLEFCAQVQDEQSFEWDAYEGIVRSTIERVAENLNKPEQQALWLQTEAGQDWIDKASADTAVVPVGMDDLVQYVYSAVWQRAADFEDDRLERYLAGECGVGEDGDTDEQGEQHPRPCPGDVNIC